MPRDQLVFFADMLAAIEKIQRYLENITLEEFLEDEMRIDAVVRNLEIIGDSQIPFGSTKCLSTGECTPLI